MTSTVPPEAPVPPQTSSGGNVKQPNSAPRQQGSGHHVIPQGLNKECGFRYQLSPGDTVTFGLPINAVITKRTNKEVDNLAQTRVDQTVKYLQETALNKGPLNDVEYEKARVYVQNLWNHKSRLTMTTKELFLDLCKALGSTSATGEAVNAVATSLIEKHKVKYALSVPECEDLDDRIQHFLLGVKALGIQLYGNNRSLIAVDRTALHPQAAYGVDIDLLADSTKYGRVAVTIVGKPDTTKSDILLQSAIANATHIGSYAIGGAPNKPTSSLKHLAPITVRPTTIRLVVTTEGHEIQKINTTSGDFVSVRSLITAGFFFYDNEKPERRIAPRTIEELTL